MKINKILTENKLRESDDGLLVNPEEVIIDTNNSSSEVAGEVQTALEVQTDGNAKLSDADASKIAAEVKDIAVDVDAKQAVIIPKDEDIDDDDEYITENALTHVLDMAYANAKTFRRRKERFGTNVLIVGLPGSGKTAIVSAWCRQHGIPLIGINARNQKLETAINGMPIKVGDSVKYVQTDFLDPLKNSGECIMFLDEYNRQTNPQIRGGLLTLINEKRTPDGRQDFSDTLLFTVACINPAVRTDPGAAPLNDAERSRFIYTIADFDSDNETALDYINTVTANKLRKLGIKLPDSEISSMHLKKRQKPAATLSAEDERNADIDEILKIDDITKYILAQLEFDTKDDLQELNMSQKNLLNQRLLTDAIANAHGDKEALLTWVENYSNMLDKDKEQFRNILSTYVLDLPALRKKYGIVTVDKENNNAENAEEETKATETQVDTEEDDDEDLFVGNKASATGKIAPTANEVRSSFDSIVDAW